MSSSNHVAATQPKFSVAITTKTYQDLIKNTLKEPGRANRFIASITSAVAVNPALQTCTAGTILSGALLGESLNLSPSPQLGQYYLVPFKSKAKVDKATGVILEPECNKATFVLGYKGYIQLALRTGQYKKLNVLEIKEGELNYFDPLNEELDVTLIDDFSLRENAETIGYYAMFEYDNGFRKAIYWSKDKMIGYADKYSPAFSEAAYRKLLNGEIAEKDMWKYSSFWYKQFDDMAKKTMLRQLISHWGIMSTEMTEAFEKDNSVINSDNGGLEVEEAEAVIEVAEAKEDAAEAYEEIDMSAL